MRNFARSEMVGAFGEVVQMVDKTTSKKKKAEKEKEKEEAAKQKGKRVSFAAGKELTQEREFTKDKHEVEADDESDEPPVKKGKQVDQVWTSFHPNDVTDVSYFCTDDP